MATGNYTEAQILNGEGASIAWIQLAANEAETAETAQAGEDGHAEDAGHGAEGDGEMTHGEEMAHEGGGMPQLDVATYPNLIFWLVLCLIATYIIFSRIALPRIGGTIENRTQTIQRDLDRAAEMKLKAEEAEEQYNQALADARSRAHAIAEDTKADIQAKVDEASAKADAEIAKQSEASAKRIAEVQKEADASVKEVATDVTKAILEALSSPGADDKSVTAAVDKVLKG